VLEHHGYGDVAALEFAEVPRLDSVAPRVRDLVERILNALPSGGFYD
jgi:hypothetical protein